MLVENGAFSDTLLRGIPMEFRTEKNRTVSCRKVNTWTWLTDRQTDRQTTNGVQHRPRLCIASRKRMPSDCQTHVLTATGHDSTVWFGDEATVTECCVRHTCSLWESTDSLPGWRLPDEQQSSARYPGARPGVSSMTKYRIGPYRTASDLNWAPGGPLNCPSRWSDRSRGDWVCVCVIKTLTFFRCEWISMGPLRSFRGPVAQFRSDVVRCGDYSYPLRISIANRDYMVLGRLQTLYRRWSMMPYSSELQ